MSGQAAYDDTIPLTHPIRTASGIPVDKIFVAKGTVVRIPMAGVNKSETLWGPDAAKFDPGRWLASDGESRSSMGRMQEVKGYKHLLTFGNGSRMCLGKNFALLEVKVRYRCLVSSFARAVIIRSDTIWQAVLSVLVRNFSFEFPHGPETKLDRYQSFIMHPKVAGEEGPRVPLVVKRVEYT